MAKSIIIVGAGAGQGLALAERFGREGFQIGFINRDAEKAAALLQQLTAKGITAYTHSADVTRPEALEQAIQALKTKLGDIHVLLYNAAHIRQQDILETTPDNLIADFKVNVAAALQSTQLVFEELQKHKGAILFSGGGLAIEPKAAYGSLSIGKAGIRSLALQLHDRLKAADVFVGTLSVTAHITPESTTHSPAILADIFWQLYQDRKEVEIVH
ncbi:SDR family NAD(P)-dependent oxidoreductase [Chitinophaga nivalis]|uniref:SDR family oxidoreductase n=1 Tax=Chitinophaga nivalis TaxID=2991709 RepID=A0ABT3ITB3_9BACT|nr:SDR family oxidoreductase [Chitinophaga nivalis]MCW3463150.1 SDR family oxidoreductase [Chitinophaga nivalis]MCW3487160.1 SDR family oxidoreductase [Chitinophaga nivalis]